MSSTPCRRQAGVAQARGNRIPAFKEFPFLTTMEATMEAITTAAPPSNNAERTDLGVLPRIEAEVPSSLTDKDLWEDVTATFREARDKMEPGEMIHHPSFSLHAAMSAIELMDPKMDVGFGESTNVSDVRLPAELSDSQVITIMDQLLVCLMSWMDGHNLPQTVFSCVYSQRMREIPRFELFAFMHVLFAVMDTTINLVLDEKVADEEDFMASTYGFTLQPLSSDTNENDGLVLQRIMNAVEDNVRSADISQRGLAEAIATRVRFLVEFYRTMQCLSGFSTEHAISDAIPLLANLNQLADEWISFTQKYNEDATLLKTMFDSSINRHLMTSSPPRTAPLFNFDSASVYLKRLLHELTESLQLERLMLPALVAGTNPQYSSQRHSLHVALHSISCYSAKFNPSILVRSVLSRIMLPSYSSALFGRDDAEMKQLFSTDIGLSGDPSSHSKLTALAAVSEGVSNTFKCFCHNITRQRRLLLRISRWWDHYVCLTALSKGRSEVESEGQESQKDGGSNGSLQEAKTAAEHEQRKNLKASGYRSIVGNLFSDMTPVQVVAYEVTARLMIQHWLLGFECELYQDYEYGAVFFYVAYALSSLTNATTSLGENGKEGLSLHPPRFALYQMDEARLWMCRALHSALLALSRGNKWDYSCRRQDSSTEAAREMFGTEELWYEQRFGVAAALVNGPAHADYSSFISFKKSHEESLRANAKETDIVPLLLKDAAKGFLMARRILETAKKFAEICSSNFVLEEILQIARVAVENSLALAQLIRNYIPYVAEQGKPLQSKQHVSFNFTRHRHFPVIQITPSEPHR